MKKTEYSESYTTGAEDMRQTLDAGKPDEQNLPEFSREVPASTKKSENGDSITIEYEWKGEANPEIMKIKKIHFKKEEKLTDLYRIASRDGSDSICFKHNNNTYIMRKAMKEIAEALYKACDKIKCSLESVVGYLRTVLGNEYVITRVEGEAWTFDKRIARADVNYVDVDSLRKDNRSKLCEMITERIAELHSNNLIIGRFTLNNVLLNGEGIKITDLRRLRVSRRKPFVVEEFKNIMQYLFAIGFATREDVYCALAYYAAQNEEQCNEWYKERSRKNADDQLDIVDKMEEEIYS